VWQVDVVQGSFCPLLALGDHWVIFYVEVYGNEVRERGWRKRIETDSGRMRYSVRNLRGEVHLTSVHLFRGCGVARVKISRPVQMAL